MVDDVSPFTLAIDDDILKDLKTRLASTRWPEKELVDDWSQGVPLSKIRPLVEYWQSTYDWRRCEAMLNSFGQFETQIDGLNIHFLHIKSKEKNALPLLLTHGWPGSIIEFHKVIGPLTDPVAYGSSTANAFDVVIPSLPGFGFSEKPSGTGWNVERIAAAWDVLMKRLGYDKYVAQGGDWGAIITTALGAAYPKGLEAIHVNMPIVLPDGPYENLSDAETEMMDAIAHYDRWDSGYSKQQSSRPQTLGYLLADSPVGQAAWIYEKFWSWMDCSDDPLNAVSYDEMLDNIMLYWLTNTGASSGRIYWESFEGIFAAVELDVPTGITVFPKEIYRAPKSWAERCIHNLNYWSEPDKGGHFAAFEQPELFVNELRDCFKLAR